MSVLRRIKLLLVANHHEPIKLEAIETWMVRYSGRHGYSGMYTYPMIQAFTNKKDAQEFANALKEAYALTGNKADIGSVWIEKA